jgi:hypothetical protein
MSTVFIRLLDLLPINIFHYLQEFLLVSWENRFLPENQNSERNWKAFLNLNRQLYHSQIRKETIFVLLSTKFSIRYLQDHEFRDAVLRTIYSCKNQLGIKFHQLSSNTINPLIKPIFTTKPEDSLFKNLYYLSMQNCNVKIQLEYFQNIFTLEFIRCTLIHDLIFPMNPDSYDYEKDVLQNVSNLILRDCPTVDYLIALPDLMKLSLINCLQIPTEEIYSKDLFPNLLEFTLHDQRLTNNQLKEFFQFSPKKKLTLNCPNISSNLSCLETIEELSLSFCFQLKEIPSLPANIVKLSLQHCHQIKSISHLQSLLSLTITSCHQIEEINFLQLNHLEYLNISYCPKITQLNIIHHDSMDKMGSVDGKQKKLRNVILSNCFGLVGINVDHQIIYCDILSCDKLKYIHVDATKRIYFLTVKLFPMPSLRGTVTVCKHIMK